MQERQARVQAAPVAGFAEGAEVGQGVQPRRRRFSGAFGPAGTAPGARRRAWGARLGAVADSMRGGDGKASWAMSRVSLNRRQRQSPRRRRTPAEARAPDARATAGRRAEIRATSSESCRR